MAGANAAWSRELGTPGNIEDGIATAYEISHLNLSNTKLVVLSACETGLGDIKGSEGVYGLQRAFKMAGADYLLVSLWQVPDKETVEFMDLFYQSWLSGKTIHEAFAKAQKKMRKKYKDVYKWGAWVLVE
jgi:CHAT domain-containing protein